MSLPLAYGCAEMGRVESRKEPAWVRSVHSVG